MQIAMIGSEARASDTGNRRQLAFLCREAIADVNLLSRGHVCGEVRRNAVVALSSRCRPCMFVPERIRRPRRPCLYLSAGTSSQLLYRESRFQEWRCLPAAAYVRTTDEF